jgi:hypothetical protein
VRIVERGRLYIFAGLAVTSGLVSCTQPVEVSALDPSPRVATKERPVIVSIPPETKPTITRLGETDQLDVIGLDQFEIQSRLGPATQDLQHLPAVEAVFSAERCTLDVTLYPDVQTRIYHALAYKVASDVDTVKERRRCLDAFAARLHGKPVDPSADKGSPG